MEFILWTLIQLVQSHYKIQTERTNIRIVNSIQGKRLSLRKFELRFREGWKEEIFFGNAYQNMKILLKWELNKVYSSCTGEEKSFLTIYLPFLGKIYYFCVRMFG